MIIHRQVPRFFMSLRPRRKSLDNERKIKKITIKVTQYTALDGETWGEALAVVSSNTQLPLPLPRCLLSQRHHFRLTPEASREQIYVYERDFHNPRSAHLVVVATLLNGFQVMRSFEGNTKGKET